MKGLYNISVETVTKGFIQQGAIVFDSIIRYVGPIQQVPAFDEEMEWIDGKGGVVFPGFIDVHTHLGINEEGIGAEGDDYNETSHPVTPHIRVIDGINSFDPAYYRALSGGITTVHILPGSSNVIGGLTAVLKVKPDRSVEQQVITFPAGLKISFGENPKMAYPASIGSRMGLAARIREAFWQTVKTRQEPPDTMAEEAMQYVLVHRLPVRAHVHRADDILTAIRIGKEFDLDLTLVHATESGKILNEIKESGYDVVLGPTMIGKTRVELANQSWEIYRQLEQAGIPFSITTDHPVFPIEELITSVRHAIKHGLSEQKALEAITIQAAKSINLSDRLGSIEVGKDADLVLWSSNPLRDFKAKVVRVFVDGQEVL
ncbi:amidohydrolase family protein [Jeotgalibacillus proteolyticus]|uniref:amidohydrolase family protein n=1 Tax=Jeotgalibacillus proteolyticus TaxID=2082395 RepID=UPI003CEED8FA